MNPNNQLAYIILTKIYKDLEPINNYEKRIYAAKKITIKIILNKCQCNCCINAAYFIYQL